MLQKTKFNYNYIDKEEKKWFFKDFALVAILNCFHGNQFDNCQKQLKDDFLLLVIVLTNN